MVRLEDDESGSMHSHDSSGIPQPATNSNHTHRQIAADHSIQAATSSSEQDSSESTGSEQDSSELTDSEQDYSSSIGSSEAIQVPTVQIKLTESEAAQIFVTITRSSRIIETEEPGFCSGTRYSRIERIEEEGTSSEQRFSTGDESADSRGAIQVQTEINEEEQFSGTRYSRIVESLQFAGRDGSALELLVRAVQAIENDPSFGERSPRIVELEEIETESENSQNRENLPESRNQIAVRMCRINRSMKMIEGFELRHVIPRPDFGAFVEYFSNSKIRPCPAGARMYAVFQLGHSKGITIEANTGKTKAGERIRFTILDGGRWQWLMGLRRKSVSQIAVEMEASGPQNNQLDQNSFEDQARVIQSASRGVHLFGLNGGTYALFRRI